MTRLGPLLQILLLAALLGLTYVLGARGPLARTTFGTEARTITPRDDLAGEERSAVELFDRASRSVVYVSPLREVAYRESPFTIRTEQVPVGTGSGFVWDKAGHIVTNYHVVAGAQAVLVTLFDRTAWQATTALTYADKDLAVLRIDAPPEALYPLAVGTSMDLQVGQTVYAIGNPYGLDTTLTHGLVSALGREIESINGRVIQGVIQTDAAINPGNSGGPLLDSSGRLIGVNTQIYSESGSSAGLGFSVPVDTVNEVVTQLISEGRVIRPGLGVLPGNDREIEMLGLDGVPIVSVGPGSAAEHAGLRGYRQASDGRWVLGDVILKVDGQPTGNLQALLNALERYEVGDTVTLTLRRDGNTLRQPVTLQALD